ncbi:Alpha/beta fold hydrolase [Sphingomonas antarctica]|uniref:alpha/beta fold hydrolase n=1 Tax=Sphingomonas antarctica TaxID=2040274 RepID=UPI0039E865F2
MNRMEVLNGNTKLSVLIDGPDASESLPILCLHGWPELAFSWRHQLVHFAKAGYRIAALDVRGYGDSDRPDEIAAYTMAELTSDVAAVIDALGGRAILFGHDWGAPIVWQTSIRYPEKVAAVAGLSVPYRPMTDTSFLDIMRHVHKDSFFYQLYFQEPGVAEAEFEGDPDALSKIYWGISGEGMLAQPMRPKPKGDRFLTGMVRPPQLPDWLPAEDLSVYETVFRRNGWRGPLNRYRAQDQDHVERGPVLNKHIAQPATFIGGALDPVRHFVPGVDTFATAGAFCDDFRGATIIDGAGHWVQQEAPTSTNAALMSFVRDL